MVLPFSSHLLLEDLGNLSVMPQKLAIVALNLGKYVSPHSTVTHFSSPNPTKLKATVRDKDTLIWRTFHTPAYIQKRKVGVPVPMGHVVSMKYFNADESHHVKSVDLTSMAETLQYKSVISIHKICEEAKELWVLSADPKIAALQKQRRKLARRPGDTPIVSSDVDAYAHVFKQKRIELMRSYFSLLKRILDYSLDASDQLPPDWNDQVFRIEREAARRTGIESIAKFNPGRIFGQDKWSARQYRDAIETIPTIQSRIDAHYPPPFQFSGVYPENRQQREAAVNLIRTKWFTKWDQASKDIERYSYFGI